MHNYMCSTNSVFVSIEENEKYSVIQAISRHAGLDSQTREDIKWEENGQYAVADQQKQPIEHGKQPFSSGWFHDFNYLITKFFCFR